MMNNLLLRPMNFTDRVYRLTPWAIDTLKLVALVAMLIDHTNTIFSLQRDYLQVIGRVAFPLFALIWAHNWVMNEHKTNRQTSVNRMWVWAIITQPFYYYAHIQNGWTWHDANILFCFATASQTLLWVNSRNALLTPLAIVLIFATAYCTQAREYGVVGMAFLFACFVFYSLRGKVIVLLVHTALLAYGAYFLNSRLVSLAVAGAVLPWMIMAIVLCLPGRGTKRYLPAQTFYYAYAGHLVVFAAIVA
jgi:type-F conjugative transfer system pilin acetylase TraX